MTLNQFCAKKRKTIYLHIGPPKTASTTLQSFFQELYKRNGKQILFPETGRLLEGQSYFRDDIYRGKVLESGPIGSHVLLFWKLKDVIYGEHTENLWQKLKEEINEFPGSAVILSAEGFWFLNKLEIDCLCRELEGHKVKVVLYIRNQSHKILSMYTQYVKAGPVDEKCLSFSEFLQNKDNRIYDEIDVIRKWHEKIPADSELLIVRNFDDIVSKTSFEEDFIINVLHEKIGCEYNRNSAVRKNSKFQDHIYQIIIAINAAECFLGCPLALRGFFYKIRDLISKSQRVRNYLGFLKIFFKEPLFNENDITQLEESINRRKKLLLHRERTYYEGNL